MKIVPESITKGWDAKETLLSKCPNMTRFKKAMIQTYFNELQEKLRATQKTRLTHSTIVLSIVGSPFPLINEKSLARNAQSVFQQLINMLMIGYVLRHKHGVSITK